MSDKIVYSGQSFLDKVLENTGSIEAAFEMALLNNMNVTDDVAVGSELKTSPIIDNYVFNYFDNTNRPATNYLLIAEEIINEYEFPQGEFPISL